MVRLYILPYVFSILCAALLTSSPLRAQGFIELFDDPGYKDRWYISNHDQGGEGFPTSWRRGQVSVNLPSVKTKGGGHLEIDLTPVDNEDAPKPFVSGEVQRDGDNHYGTYEVVMQPARGSGTVSAFFLYTGPYFGDPHDEIDFEFLGRDTRKAWINAFSNGQKMPGEWIDLGFDAAEAPHLYAVTWLEDSITWFVDGKEFYKITSETHAIPKTPGKIFLNSWAGNEDQKVWLGSVAPDVSGTSKFHCVSYRPIIDLGLTCSDTVSNN